MVVKPQSLHVYHNSEFHDRRQTRSPSTPFLKKGHPSIPNLEAPSEPGELRSLFTPAYQRCSPGQASSKRPKQNQIARPQITLTNGPI